MSFVFDSSDFEKGLEKYSLAVMIALRAGLAAAADELLRDSTDIVPFQKGFSGGLASTASKTDPRLIGNISEVTVGYNKEYAARLHEDLSLVISQKNASAGQTRQQKYLEKPMKENAKEYAKITARIIKQRSS